jgi:phage terminase large subunit-like protein
VDQDAVKGWLLNLRERYDVAEVPMDPHNATKLQTELQGLGFNVVNMRQGWVTMSPAIKQTEILIRQRKIRHGGNPVLRWMFSNVAVKRDSNDNLSLHKGRSADRIDGIVALCMAAGRAAASDTGSELVKIWGIA